MGKRKRKNKNKGGSKKLKKTHEDSEAKLAVLSGIAKLLQIHEEDVPSTIGYEIISFTYHKCADCGEGINLSISKRNTPRIPKDIQGFGNYKTGIQFIFCKKHKNNFYNAGKCPKCQKWTLDNGKNTISVVSWINSSIDSTKLFKQIKCGNCDFGGRFLTNPSVPEKIIRTLSSLKAVNVRTLF